MSDEQKTEDAAKDDPTAKLAECEKKRDEYLSGWQRERADFQNYKKEEFKRIQEARDAIASGLAEDLLPVLDSFDIALDFIPDDLKSHKWIHGTAQIKMQMLDILKRQGVEVIKVSEGDLFNPAMHEAMAEVESNKPEGSILEEVQRVYAFNGKVIRPARVKVAKRQIVDSK